MNWNDIKSTIGEMVASGPVEWLTEERVELPRNEVAKLKVNVEPNTTVDINTPVSVRDSNGVTQTTTVGQYVGSDKFAKHGTPQERLDSLVYNYQNQGSGASGREVHVSEDGTAVEIDPSTNKEIPVAPLPKPNISPKVEKAASMTVASLSGEGSYQKV